MGEPRGNFFWWRIDAHIPRCQALEQELNWIGTVQEMNCIKRQRDLGIVGKIGKEIDKRI
jgi:hypothetical protein